MIYAAFLGLKKFFMRFCAQKLLQILWGTLISYDSPYTIGQVSESRATFCIALCEYYIDETESLLPKDISPYFATDFPAAECVELAIRRIQSPIAH